MSGELSEERKHYRTCSNSIVKWRRTGAWRTTRKPRSEEHTSELQSQSNLVCRLLLEKKKKTVRRYSTRNDLRCPTSPRMSASPPCSSMVQRSLSTASLSCVHRSRLL